jgi:hypothetical protein
MCNIIARAINTIKQPRRTIEKAQIGKAKEQPTKNKTVPQPTCAGKLWLNQVD